MMTLLKRSIALLLSCSLVLASSAEGFAYQTDQSAPPPPPQAAQQTPEQLQQLVAPIALYPDALVAQILAAATYPAEIVEADRCVASIAMWRSVSEVFGVSVESRGCSFANYLA
jgi:hypothetical protein